MELYVFADSLKMAFRQDIKIFLLEKELKITIARKTAWIGSDGRLTGESGVGTGALEIGVDVGRVVVPTTGAAIVASV
ncbi:MAG: hypothetical protein A3H49_08705 [Nitrospirae bacterium RIFCSPLOWO2_02_FULL_62_14]|nr:MAG: hypothetical protein A3H49_08705 [Nitrospirae bacterium RIFCSPLOWO2_02_FULL_62_14]